MDDKKDSKDKKILSALERILNNVDKEIEKLDGRGAEPAAPSRDETDLAKEIREIAKTIDSDDPEALKEFSFIIEGFNDNIKDSLQNELKKDGRFVIDVEEDKMMAYITIVPPFGHGRPVEDNDVLRELTVKGIKAGILESAIKDAVDKVRLTGETVKEAVIAEGTCPVNGEDGKITYHFHMPDKHVSEPEDGAADYFNLDLIANVTEGQLLAEKSKPVPGSNGFNIYGDVLKAESGKEASLMPGENVLFKDNKYISKINGQVLLVGNKLSVSAIFVVNGDVNYSTGNINFLGSVIVKGNVEDNFKITAEGNVTIYENLGGATVISGGDVAVKNGFVGKGKGSIKAKGNVYIRFIENGLIETEKSIFVDNAVMQSNLMAKEKVISKKGKGLIIGGLIKATKSVEAKNIGSPMGASTIVMVGVDFMVEKQLEEIDRKIKVLKKNLETLNQADDIFKTSNFNPADLSREEMDIYSKLITRKRVLKGGLQQLAVEKLKLINDSKKSVKSTVRVAENIYPGVKIIIRDKVLDVKQSIKFVTISESDDGRQVSIKPYFS